MPQLPIRCLRQHHAERQRGVRLRELRYETPDSSDAHQRCSLMRDTTAVIVFVATIIFGWGSVAYVGVMT
jgi:hypothetical protein